MRSYHKITVEFTVNGITLGHDIESWREHGHSSVYSGGFPLFDGSSVEAARVIQAEKERLIGVAKQYGAAYEVKEVRA